MPDRVRMFVNGEAMSGSRLLPAEPPELELGIIELADGTGSLAMRMRAEALQAPGVRDISDRGGWLRYTGQEPR